MPILYVYLIMLSLISSLGLTILSHVEKRILSLYEISYQNTGLIFSQAIERYITENNTVPASLNILVSYEGNQILSYFDLDRLGYAVVTFNDLGLSYQRAILWHKRFDRYLNNTDILENNQIGTSTFFEMGDYKAPNNVYWFQTNTLSNISNLRSDFYAQLDESAQRIVYSTNNLPIIKKNGDSLPIGTITSLADAVGYTGSFTSCVGIYNFDGAPLTCSDLFTRDGTLVFYQLLSESTAVLSIESSKLTDATGSPLFLYTHVMVSAS